MSRPQSSRARFGYVQNTMNNSNPIEVQPHRRSLDNVINYNNDIQQGTGFMENVRHIYEKGKDVINMADDLYSGNLGTALRNMIPDSDDTARKGFTGEKHAILKLSNGKNGVANFMGPGTHVIERIRRNDPGRTFSDKVARRHDLDYALAASENTKEKQLSAIRTADDRMINTLEKNKSKDSSRNINMGLQLIRAKKMGEDLGVLSKSKFAGDLSKMSDADKVMLMNARRKSTQEGFGLGISGGSLVPTGSGLNLPGSKLKQKLLKQNSNKPKKSRSSIAMPSYSSMDGKTLLGTGINLSGGSLLKSIGTSLAKNELPKLLQTIGISIPQSTLSKIVDTVMDSSSNIKEKIRSLTHSLLPLFVVKKAGMSGQGLKLAGQGLKSIMEAIPTILIKKLNEALTEFFKSMMSGSGKKSKKSLKGKGSFWHDFSTTFVKLLKPATKVLAGVATVLGQPEFAVPLGVVSEML